MNIISAVIVLYNLFSLFGCNASNPQKTMKPKELLMEMQEKALSDCRVHKRITFAIDVAPALEIDLIDLLTELEFLEERYLILFWISCGTRRICFEKANYGVYITEVAREKNHGEKVFRMMKESYKQFLFQRVLSYNGNKEGLLFRARDFYYGKLHSIWRKLMKPGIGEFYMLEEEFFICEELLNKDLEVLLDLEFTKFLQSIDSGDKNLIFKYEKRVHSLVQILSKNKSKMFGFQMIANHPCPYLTLLYFYYQVNEPTQDLQSISLLKREEGRKAIFGIAFYALQKWVNFNVRFAFMKLDFTSEFKSPYPELFNDEELKVIIAKIVSKCLDLFDHSHLISDKKSLFDNN
jgi:hypothetical protein